MAKKIPKTSTSRNIEPTENPESNVTWVATSLLEDDIPSTMKPEKLEEAKLLMGKNDVAVIPEADQRADWFCPGWVCFYYYPFDVGLTLPFSKLAMDLLDSLTIAPGHLMPFSWRVVACLDTIETKHKLGINIDVMKASYVLKKYSGCRYTFTNVNKDEPQISNIDGVNDRGWKGNYLFAKKSSLADGSEKFIDYWSADEPQFVLDESDTVAKGIVEKVMAWPLEDRSWPTCMNRPVRNVGSAIASKSGKLIVKPEASAGEKSVRIPIKSAAHRTSSKKPLPLAAVKIDDDSVHSVSSDTIESPKEEKMDVDVNVDKELEMSSSRLFAREYKPPVIKPVVISARDLFAKRARDEKSTETDSSKSVMVVSPLTSPLNKKLRFQAPPGPSKSDFSLPLVAHGYAVEGKPESFAHLLTDSLLPQSIEGHSSKTATEVIDNCAGQAFHVLQSALVARGRCHELEKKLKKLQVEHKGCAERLRVSQELASIHLKAKNAIQQEFDDFTDKIQEMEKKVTEDANRAIQQSVMKAPVEMMLEYQNDDWASWDLDESIRIYNEAYPEDAFIVDVMNMDEDEPATESPKGSPKSSPKGDDKGSPGDEEKDSPTQ